MKSESVYSYGDNSTSITVVKNWFNDIQKGRMSVSVERLNGYIIRSVYFDALSLKELVKSITLILIKFFW